VRGTRAVPLLLSLLVLAAGRPADEARAACRSGSAAGARDTTERPAVHVLTTGGTIASRPGENLAGRELVAGVPELRDVARVTVEEFSDVGSSKMTPARWLELGRRIREVFHRRPELSGVVVTHGTDTMEETAYFLHLTLSDSRPVVVTGAMRPPGTPGADGPANLMDAVRAAASPASRGRGTLVAMNDELHGAAAVRKAHTSRPDAFVSPGTGPVGEVSLDTVAYDSPGEEAPMRGRFSDALSWDRLPRVRIAYSYPGADQRSVLGPGREGALGLVVASMGRGNLSAPQEEAVRTLVDRGVPVVMSSRTMAGPVPVGDPGDGVLGAGRLCPQKARVLLGLGLTETGDPGELARMFARVR